MKRCPFCQEEIQDGAIKCGWCGSSLLPAQAAPTPDIVEAAEQPQGNEAHKLSLRGNR